MNRQDVTEMIIINKKSKGLTWLDIANTIGLSKEWTTAALMGQMTLNESQATIIGAALDLPEQAAALLQTVPYKGSLPTAVPTDPLLYRFYELLNVYGTTIK